MVVAVVGDELPLVLVGGEEAVCVGLDVEGAVGVAHAGGPFPGDHDVRLKELLLRVELERPRAFLLVHDVRRRPGGDEHGPRRQRDQRILPGRQILRLPLEDHGLQRAALVGNGFDRIDVLGEDDPFLERLDDFLVIQPVRRRIDHPLAIGERDAAPGPDQGHEIGRLACRGGACALGADRAAVRQVLVEQLELLGVVHRADTRLAELADERLVLRHGLFDLQRVVRHQLGRGVDGRQTAADDDRRQPRLKVRQRFALERAGQLQRHQEIAGLPDPADQVVLHVDDRRPSGAGRDRDVVEAVLPRVLDRHRAAEPDRRRTSAGPCAARASGAAASGSSCPSAP